MIAIFDLDGTLIDSAPDIHAGANATLAHFGLPPVTFAQSRGFVGGGARIFVERMERAVTGTNTPDLTNRMHRHFLEVYETSHALTTVYDGVTEALSTLESQGWRLGLCTNKPLGPTRSVLAHLGWADRFDVVIGGDSLPVVKPDPAPLRAVIEAMAKGPLVYVGDSEVDSATAKAARVPFALFTQGYRKTPVDQLYRTATFDHWRELPAIAARIAR